LLVIALALTLALILAIAWAALGRTVWWVPAFALSFAGGYFNAGVKIYPHEIGIALSVIALGALLIFHTPRRRARPRLDWSVYALAFYMLAHLAVSCSLALYAGTDGTGTIVRSYANGLWGVGFAALFWNYGSLRHFKIALVLATVICVVRVAMGAFGIGAAGAAEVESGALFVPPDSLDLRVSAVLMIALLVIWFYRYRERWIRLLLGGVYLAAIYLAWMGASRVAALSAAFTLLLWALVQRRRAGLFAGAAGVLVAAIVAIAVNASPAFYESLPEGMQRSLSAIVATRDLDEHAETAGSNEWHFLLLQAGVQRWTRNAATVIVGNPVEGWRADYATLPTLEEKVDVAARLATYENALFTILSTLGLVGLLLWARALYWLYRPFTVKVLRHGIRHRDEALAFVAVQSLIVYLAFSWIAGGYPGTLCILGALAAATYYEHRHAAQHRVPPSTLRRAQPRRADTRTAS
jgi:hypothetical protein